MRATLLRVLIIHNRYRQPGGEDVVASAQARLLREKGHEVRLFEKDNREIDSYGLLRKAALFFQMADNPFAASEVQKIVRDFKPHVAHVHNTLPLLSPSIYAPLAQGGVKVIQFLHNYRLICAAGTLYRDGSPCALCVDGGPKYAVKYNCWAGSKFASLGFTRMLRRHRRLRTWHTKVDLFVALNSFMRDLLVKHDIVPAGKIVVQPNFLEVERPQAAPGGVGEGFVFAARLVAEKGVATLLGAHELFREPRLEIIGDGPLLPPTPGPPFAGRLPREEVLKRLEAARALIFPSEWPEGCPSTILEAMALGKAVIASRVPGAAELVEDGVTGLLFEPGDAAALAAQMKKLHEDSALAARLGGAGREKYLREYTPEAGYRRLEGIYSRLNLV
jgi:glycosyltransferase involved in cell wall biosynthesis